MNALRDLEVAVDAANDVRRVGPGRVLVANPEAARGSGTAGWPGSRSAGGRCA